MNSKPKFHCLVADTTAFINNVPFQDYAEYIITVPEVVKEIKNKRQLKRLCVLPYELTVDEPSPESVRHVIEFAKKTGDYLSLSSADIKVIALTYQLEKELVGTSHLRLNPVLAKTIASRDKPTELVERTLLAGFYMPPNEAELSSKTLLNKDLVIETPDSKKEASESDTDDLSDEELEDIIEDLAKVDVSETTDNAVVSSTLVALKDDLKQNTAESTDTDSDEDNEYETSEDDDEQLNSWITPSNLIEVKSLYGKDAADDQVVRVACMSTDYAIQNVLKQINLNIAALDGRIIKNMRTYILRCYACFKTTSLMTKMFCPKCGNKTLKRVAVSLDENGQQVIHINTRRPLTAKGKNTSIPRPRGGKHSSNPILFEDQNIPKQMPSRIARTKTNALEDDYVAGFSPFVTRDVDSRSALLRAKGGNTLKQWARNNDFKNAQQRRKK